MASGVGDISLPLIRIETTAVPTAAGTAHISLPPIQIGQAVEHDTALPVRRRLTDVPLPIARKSGASYEGRSTQSEPPAKSYVKELGLLLAFLLWLFEEETETLRHVLREFIFWLLRGGR